MMKIKEIFLKQRKCIYIFCSFVLISIVTQHIALDAAAQEEQKTKTTEVLSPCPPIDQSNNLGVHEKDEFAFLREAQDNFLNNASHSSAAFRQVHENDILFKELTLVLYPTTRSTLYIAYPPFSAPAITNYIQEYEAAFREEAKEANQGYFDFFRDRGHFGRFAVATSLLFKVLFYSDELRIVSFFNSQNAGGGTGNKTAKVFLLLADGKELSHEDIFVDYNKSISRIAGIAKEMLENMFMEKYGKGNFREKWIEKGTDPKTADYHKHIAFNQNGDLRLYFDKYQVAAGVEGIVNITIPYSTIELELSTKMRTLLGK